MSRVNEFWGSTEAKSIFGLSYVSNSFSREEVESCIPERERFHQAFIDLLEHNKPYKQEYQIITRNTREHKTILAFAELSTDEFGNPIKDPWNNSRYN